MGVKCQSYVAYSAPRQPGFGGASREAVGDWVRYQHMSLLSSSECVICGKELKTGEPYLDTSGCVFTPEHRLWKYCDAPMHIRCLETWPDRVEFSEAYYNQRREQYDHENWLVLAEKSNWFVGFIPPGPYMQVEGSEDLVEVRIKDWPFVLWGHAERWTEFFKSGWREYHPALTGQAVEKARAVLKEAEEVLPDTETIVDLINRSMGWSEKKKVSYQDLVIEAMNKAMAIRLKDEKVFENFPLNTLEAVIAIFWMVERSLHGLPREKLEKAGSLLMDELLAWLSQSYSREDIPRLVIPAFKKRLDEYSSLFVIKPGEEPRIPLMRTFKRVVEHVFGEDDAHISRIVAALLLWWQPISQEGARITDLDKQSEVVW